MSRRTVAALWRDAVARAADAPPFLVEEGGRWRPVAWEEAGRAVEEIAAGLHALGLRRGDRAAILGRSRLEWALADHALVALGVVVVPIMPGTSTADQRHILAHSAVRAALVEDAAERERLRALPELPALERVLVMRGAPDGLDELRERGRPLLAADPDLVARAADALGEDDLLTLVYTSGTTGRPKGCLLTHRNWRAMVDSMRRIRDLVRPGEVAMLHLPLAHVFGRLVELMGADAGLTLALCPDAARLGSALRDVRPQLLPSVPGVFEALDALAHGSLERVRGPRRAVVGWALGVGRRASRRRRVGRREGPLLAVQRALAERLVLSRVTARLGGRLRLAISGGAKLVPDVAERLHALGVLVLEGYGLTECTTVVAVNRPDRYRFGTVGPPAPGVEVRIAPDGEILVRGETVFAGYHRDHEATRAVLDEGGWLRTGDLGFLDDHGFLTVTDRKKDIIVSSRGENVSPQAIEAALRASPLVSEVLVVGNGRPYLVALLAPDRARLREVAPTDEEARRVLEAVVDEVNRGRGQAERIRRFAVLPRDFLVEQGEVTPTLKLRRLVCEAHFEDVITGLYAGASARR